MARWIDVSPVHSKSPRQPPPPSVPLWVKSNYSFLLGASHPEELVDQAHALDLPSVALTDRDGFYGVVRAYLRARELGIGLIVGTELSVTTSCLSEEGGGGTPAGGVYRVVALAQSRKGYGDLCRLVSKGRQLLDKGSSLVTLEELGEASEEALLLCPEPSLLGALHERCGDRLYGVCGRHLVAEENPAEHRLRVVADYLGVPTVAAVEVLYHNASRRPLQDVLTCIRHGVALTAAGGKLLSNDERTLKSPAAMQQLYADVPGDLARTLEVAERCRFGLDELRYRYPAERLPLGRSDIDWLRELTLRGARERYGTSVPGDVLGQIDRELDLIGELDYGGYFLTMWEVVQFCRQQNILCQGRGSAANSAVCYCLGITAVDPVRLDLLFERFISRERAEPPDIDLDIEHRRREEVIQWVYQRYGRRHAAMVANFIRYRARSAVRDVGKTLGLPLTALDRLSKLLGHYALAVDDETCKSAGLCPDNPAVKHWVRLVEEIQDVPRHLSIHPGGFLLGHEPVDTLVPVEPASMEGRTVIQWDKQDIEDLGLFKVDLLGLGALTQLHGCFDLVRQHQGLELTMATIPPEDPETYAMVSAADTVGMFQIESRAQMAMLPRMQPRTFYDLVVEVAIMRPGPIQGDMVHPYLRRRRGEEPVQFPHPSLERVLHKTLGVPIFQEQVMKLAMLAADYTPGEADQLRRDMAAWRSGSRIEQHRERLITRMAQKGIPHAFAEQVFAQIRGFGEYGFPESHAASFAHIAYITAYLKRHFPAAFTCALLNAQPMGFYSPATLVEDAKRHGVTMLPIDVNHSGWSCTLERSSVSSFGRAGRPPEAPSNTSTPRDPQAREDCAVRMGLCFVKGLGEQERGLLSAAPPPYQSLSDLMRRTQLSGKALTALAEAGALQSLGLLRRDALWSVRALIRERGDSLHLLPQRRSDPATALPSRRCTQLPLFRPLSRAEAIVWDFRQSYHSTRGHPMQSLRVQLQQRGLPDARKINAMADGVGTDYVALVICRQRPSTASGVTFYTLEDETGFVNLVVWRQVFERHRVLARTAVLLGVRGTIQSEAGVVHLVAERLYDPGVSLSTEGVTPRSFH